MNELVRIENTEQSFSEDWSPATRPLLIVLTAVICLVGFLGESFYTYPCRTNFQNKINPNICIFSITTP